MMELKIAFRNLLRHRRRSVLSGLTLVVGYVLLSLSIATTAGTYSNIIEAFTRDDTGHAQIHRQGYLDRPSISKGIDDPQRVVQALEGVASVVSYAPRVLGPALAYANGKTSPVQVRGVDLEKEANTSRIRERVKKGRFLDGTADEDGRFEVLVGAALAKSLKADLGDELVLISQGADGSVANDRYVIVGVIGTAESRDRTSVIMSLEAAQAFFSFPGGVHEIAVVFLNYKRTDSGVRAIEKKLAETLGVRASELAVEPWQEVEADFYKGMEVDKRGNYVVYLIILFIVSVGVLNVIMMSILERTREFGVLRAIGSRPFEIFRLIVFETGVLACLSVLAGLMLALPLNYWFQEVGVELSTPFEMGGIRMDRMTAEVSLQTLSEPALLVVGASLLICLIPAFRAARIRVVDALRAS